MLWKWWRIQAIMWISAFTRGAGSRMLGILHFCLNIMVTMAMTITTPLWQKESTLIILWVWVAGVEQASTTVLSKNCSVMSTAFVIMLVTDERTGWRCHVQAGTGPLMQQLAQATWKGICILGGQVDGIIFIWWGMVSWAVGRCRMLDRYWIGHGSFNRFSWREKRRRLMLWLNCYSKPFFYKRTVQAFLKCIFTLTVTFFHITI